MNAILTTHSSSTGARALYEALNNVKEAVKRSYESGAGAMCTVHVWLSFACLLPNNYNKKDAILVEKRFVEIVVGYIGEIQKYCNFPITVSLNPDANFLGSGGSVKSLAEELDGKLRAYGCISSTQNPMWRGMYAIAGDPNQRLRGSEKDLI